jgi:hypothetical protein
MRYIKTVDIWALPVTAMVSHLPIGQWVSAGPPEADRSNCGRYYGIRGKNTVVVAWNGNARKAKDYREYQKTMHQYGQG